MEQMDKFLIEEKIRERRKKAKTYGDMYYSKNRKKILKEAKERYYSTTHKENKDYHKRKMKELRELNTPANIVRGKIKGRDIKEYIIFKKSDYEYIKSMSIKPKQY